MAAGRKTGGRKAGTKNRANAARQLMAEAGISVALSSGISPLEIILRVSRGGPDADGITERMLQAAIAAAPYIHPRLNANHITGRVTEGITHEERLALLERGPLIEGEAEPVREEG